MLSEMIKSKMFIFRPKRYKLSELVDWFHRVMRKDKEWGYFRYDMRFDPVFMARVTFNEMLPIQPIGQLTWEKIERVNVLFFFCVIG